MYNQTMPARSISDFENQLRDFVPLLKEKYRVQKLGIFGSYIRSEQREESDLDLLVTFTEPPGLFAFIELENFLSDTLGVKVDLVMEDALKPEIRENIISQVEFL